MEIQLSRPLGVQFIKYCLAGLFVAIVHAGVFHLAAWKLFPSLQTADYFITGFRLEVGQIDDFSRTINAMLSNVTAFFVSNFVSYSISRKWIFEPGRFVSGVEALLFFLYSGLSVFAGTAVMGVSIRYFGIKTTDAFLINFFVSIMFNFIIRKYCVFRR